MERDGAAPSDAAVVRVLNADGRPEGAGFLGGHREVITCAHVVGRALGSSSPSPAEPPAGRLWVDFPLARPGLLAEVRVVSWVPVQPDGSGDIAVLRLLADPPARATVARLVEDVAGPDLRVRTFGFPPAYDDGAWSVGRLRGRTATGWLQYDTDPASEHRVRTGFSGAPVWDVAGGGVVGMVVAADSRPDVRTAYLIPTRTLRESSAALDDTALPPCPFRGLEPFQERDARLFHGREEHARRITGLLDHASALSMVGPSGCGKSSLLHAGVLPALRDRRDREIIALRPGGVGRNPLESLALALLPALEPDLTETARLHELPGLTELLRAGRMPEIVERLLARRGRDRLLLVVDQFEEALTGAEPSELDALAAALGHALAPGSGLQLAVTLRADFLVSVLSHPGLAPLFGGDRLFTVGAMSDEELRAAVERPLDHTGVRYEPGLVDRILRDLGSDPGRLPLLEFTLTRLWERQRRGVIGHAAYESLGRVDDALVTHAEQIWSDALTEEERGAARALLVQLVHPGDERAAPTRRTLARTELPPHQWRIAQRLMTTRLVVPGEERRGGDGSSEETVELAHETLLTHWTRLREFFEADRGFRLWQEDLRRRIARWDAEGRRGSRLLRGADLRDARRWRELHAAELPPVEQEYVEASVGGARRRHVRIVALGLVLGLLAGVLALEVRARERGAVKDTATQASRVLVQQSRDSDLMADPSDTGSGYTALLLALRAYRTQDTRQTRARLGEMYARYGFADVIVPVYASLRTLLTDPVGLSGAFPTVDAEGRVIAASAADGEVVVLDGAGGSGPRRLSDGHHADVTAVSPDGSAVAMARASLPVGSTAVPTTPLDPGGLPVRLYDVRTGHVRELERPAEGDPFPEEVGIPAVDLPGLELPDLGDLADLPGGGGLTLPTEYGRLAFSPDGSVLIGQTGMFGEGGRLVLWDTADGHIRKILPGLPNAVDALWLDDGGERLITLSNRLSDGVTGTTNLLEVWDLTGAEPRGRKVLTLEQTMRKSIALDLSPDLERVAVVESLVKGTDVEQTLTVYEMPGGEVLRRERSRHQQVGAGVTVTDGASRVLVYSAAAPVAPASPRSPAPATSASGASPPGYDPFALSEAWSVDLLGSGENLSAVLYGQRGVLALVGPGKGGPIGRLPTSAPAADGSEQATAAPSSGEAKRWMADLCRALGDEKLPTAAAEKLPPGAYRGALCPKKG
ncbi:serine protease [Streptomyces sp. NPDC002734]|uniref:serine protease n=1 Tax=Streptomyces sp. NPDC002734 TaxID=3154426 RepID=UPI003325036C